MLNGRLEIQMGRSRLGNFHNEINTKVEVKVCDCEGWVMKYFRNYLCHWVIRNTHFENRREHLFSLSHFLAAS